MHIDSHHHLWNYSADEYPWIDSQKEVLKRDYTVADLESVTNSTSIDGVVTVQARQSLGETHWLLQLANEYPKIRGVVGWVPLMQSGVREEIERLSHYPLLKAVRHVVQDELDPDFLSGASFNRGIEHLKDFGLTYDILILSQQLTATISFVDRHPEQPFVLDHIAKPTIANNQFDREWEVNIRELARRPHVSCKFSGVVTEVRDDSWTTDLIRPYWQIALEAFSPQRLMFGSDWPVCLIKSSYERWHATCLELSSSLSDSEKKWFWGDTAAKVYDLS